MRLIDADELKKALKSKCNVKMCLDYNTSRCENCQTNKIVDFIDDFPTIEERPKGKWILNDMLYGSTSYRCSVCNDVTDDVPTCMNKPLYKFCPNCGADMRGGRQ